MERYTKKDPKDPSIRNHYYKLYSILTTSGVLSPLVAEGRSSATSGLRAPEVVRMIIQRIYKNKKVQMPPVQTIFNKTVKKPKNLT